MYHTAPSTHSTFGFIAAETRTAFTPPERERERTRTGRKRGPTHKDVETEVKTADEGQRGFPLCRIRKSREGKEICCQSRILHDRERSESERDAEFHQRRWLETQSLNFYTQEEDCDQMCY